MVKFLFENGAKILRTDVYGRTALSYAIINGHIVVANYLLRCGSYFDRGDLS